MRSAYLIRNTYIYRYMYAEYIYIGVYMTWLVHALSKLHEKCIYIYIGIYIRNTYMLVCIRPASFMRSSYVKR